MTGEGVAPRNDREGVAPRNDREGTAPLGITRGRIFLQYADTPDGCPYGWHGIVGKLSG